MSTQQDETYFLPKDYTPRTIRTTVEHVSNKSYWTPTRVKTSQSYQLPVYDYIQKWISTQQGQVKTLADIGCGPGTKLQSIHKAHPDITIYGVDQSSAIEYCKDQYDFGAWYVDDFEDPSTDVPDFAADLIVCADVIEHILNPDLLLEYMKKKLAKDGHIIISTPDRAALYGAQRKDSGHPDHVREWTGEEFKDYLTDRGFELLQQFHTFPVDPGLNKLAIRHALQQTLRGKSWNYNQVCLLKTKP